MVADIARITYDPTRQYRSLIAQQGRVTLEADVNEAASLAGEALRLETIDIIGPAGTPDDGYKVGSGKGPGGVSIAPGTFYLGGWRLELDKKIELAAQPEWRDARIEEILKGTTLIALLVTEQSVCAVEDQALREVALGGPDSAARTRLMQRFLRLPAHGSTCAAGAKTVAGMLEEEGVTIDPATYQLMSQATLQAGFVPGSGGGDPCTPAAAGGYLGADNQMVRVTVTDYDNAKKSGTLLWGWNNASLLYRASMTDPLTLTLINVPVDEEHAPQQGQMVEILRSTLNLGDGNFIAAHEGFVTSLAEAYSFDTGEIALNDALPNEYRHDKNPLFVRLWQASVPFAEGKATALDDVSGITVTLSLKALPHRIAARPFWRFAVRPSAPQNIYPQRYFDAPQPPDGPRQWIADLAVVEALKNGSKVIADCRVPFGPLTERHGECCGLVLGPDEVSGRGGLQAVIDSLAGKPSVLSLQPGTYTLSEPLKLTQKHKDLAIEGCTADGVILTAKTKPSEAFRLGLLLLDGVENLALRRLVFDAPVVTGNDDNRGISTVAGIAVAKADGLTIEDCAFRLAAPERSFGGALLVMGPTERVVLRRNRFQATPRGELLFGVLAMVTEKNVSAGLDQWEVDDNRFVDFTIALLAYAQLGLIRCTNNVVVNCGSGFVFGEANLGVAGEFTMRAMQDTGEARNIHFANAAGMAMQPALFARVSDHGAPFFEALPAAKAPQAVSHEAHRVLGEQMKTHGATAYRKMTADANTATANQAGAKAAPDAKIESIKIDQTSFDKIKTVSIAAELYEQRLTPALRVESNEVTLGGKAAAIGIAAIFSRSRLGSIIVNANRVIVPTTSAVPCALLLPTVAIVTSNLFAQSEAQDDDGKAVPALIVFADEPLIQVSANVVRFNELVFPARTNPPPTASWEFLNTVE